MAAERSDAASAPGEPRFAMSVDVEDYFQVWAFSDVISRDSWDGFALRAGDSTRRCLDLFDASGAKATFFTLGWIAERDPALIREIVRRGHELASHGYDHTKATAQSCDAFRQDVRRTKAMLEDIAGVAVSGYRAAGFSIDRTTPWAHTVLAEEGYLYSSSSHPIAHDHYGDATAPQVPHEPIDGSSFIEAPVATTRLWGKRISCAGGGWFRAAPLSVSTRLIARAARLNAPVIFYFHPWEIDPDQPRIISASRKAKLRHYLNLNSMSAKLDRLLAKWRWRRVDSALGLDGASS
jgi:polysaccharide deacetylase family protein (PEP-CTERM system associated)